MRKVAVDVKTRVWVEMDEGIEVTEVMENMDYGFQSETEGADIIDTQIEDWEVLDSK